MGVEIQAADILSKWYIPATMYVVTLQPIVEGGKITGGIGRYIANPDLHGAFEEPSYVDEVEHVDDVTTITTLTIIPAHMVGHPWAFPGHKSSRTMEHSIYANLARHPYTSSFKLFGYESVLYKKRLSFGDTIKVKSELTSFNGMDATADAQILIDGQVAAVMKRAYLTRSLQGFDCRVILFDQLQEGAAQTIAALLGAENQVLDGIVPLFAGTGPADFNMLPKTGDTILYYAQKLMRMGPMFSADVKMMLDNGSQKDEIGKFLRTRGLIAPKEKAI